ncbi:hypothetical protein CASFOL_002063 [Castilleja foliolosa]|uniref:Uncharacterized protein n=1 Tax=Castilleja foliolosa TaxID=1961234 RepID=A0ABD3EDH5_9LAMI
METQNPPYDYRPCCCCVANGGKKASIRAWLVPKGSNYRGINGSHRAWFGTHAGNSNDAENNVKEKVQRRPKSGGGGGAAVVGSPALLAIPAVGPRNLRKLVEKGFEGVAQLKQLYKTKEIDGPTGRFRDCVSGELCGFSLLKVRRRFPLLNLKCPGCKENKVITFGAGVTLQVIVFFQIGSFVVAFPGAMSHSDFPPYMVPFATNDLTFIKLEDNVEKFTNLLTTIRGKTTPPVDFEGVIAGETILCEGQRRMDNVTKRLNTMREDKATKEKEQTQASRILEQIVAKAKCSYEKDLATFQEARESNTQDINQGIGDGSTIPVEVGAIQTVSRGA